MLVEVLHRDGLEGAETDVEGDAGDVAAAHGEAAEQRVGEVQARRRRSDGAVVACVDRLVAVGVDRLVLALDVRWQRNVAAGPHGSVDRLAIRRPERDLEEPIVVGAAE